MGGFMTNAWSQYNDPDTLQGIEQYRRSGLTLWTPDDIRALGLTELKSVARSCSDLINGTYNDNYPQSARNVDSGLFFLFIMQIDGLKDQWLFRCAYSSTNFCYTIDIKRILFLYQYLNNIRTIGAVAPSSRFLTRRMLKPIDFPTARLIIEYGAGTGVFTKEIVASMSTDTLLLIVEKHKMFYNELAATYATNPHVIVVHDSAENINNILQEHTLTAPDYIVSGLPFATLPASSSHAILEQTVALIGCKGLFITFQYTQLQQALFSEYFKNIHTTRELRNIPPAYVLECRK